MARFPEVVKRGEGDCSAIQDVESRFFSLSKNKAHEILGILVCLFCSGVVLAKLLLTLVGLLLLLF